MGEVERKVDMLISGMKTPQKKTRSRVVTLATTMIIASALIAGASFLGYYAKMSGPVQVEDLVTISTADGEGGQIIEPAVDKEFTEASITVIPGCTINNGEHTIWLNEKYNDVDNPATVEMFSVYFHIETTENGAPSGDDDGLTVTLWDVTGPLADFEIVPDADGSLQMELTPGVGNARIFEIRVTADVSIDSTSTYGYSITMDWEE